MILRVVAKHFVAGCVVREGVVVEAAPILKWAVGKTAYRVQQWARRHHYEVQELQDDHERAHHR